MSFPYKYYNEFILCLAFNMIDVFIFGIHGMNEK